MRRLFLTLLLTDTTLACAAPVYPSAFDPRALGTQRVVVLAQLATKLVAGRPF